MTPTLAIVHSRALSGIKAPLVTVEIDLSNGLPGFTIVGLPEAAVRESKDRVRSALINTQFEFPARRITVNLAPADLPKEGGRFDLPIAIGILAASKQVPDLELSHYELVGELALSGELRAVTGILPIALACFEAKRILILPKANAHEASLVEGLTVLPANHISEVCAHLCKRELIIAHEKYIPPIRNDYLHDMQEVIGQPQAKRALEIAAAGGHHLLLMGPPGTGKTMLAARLPSILPPMTLTESLEAAALASISHQGFHFTHWQKRPFRAPHHSASGVALVGGGNPPRPGEISLSHQGVLFLDELPEFTRHVLEALREPIESGSVVISRAARQSEFPARFQLIAAMNPCPCGYYGDDARACRCTPDQIQRYRHKISGPLLDRIDLHIQMPRLPLSVVTNASANTENSACIRARVIAARDRQIARSNCSNAQLSNQQLKKFCCMEPATQTLLQEAAEKLKLSARAYHRLLKVCLTLADLSSKDVITHKEVAEALLFRPVALP